MAGARKTAVLSCDNDALRLGQSLDTRSELLYYEEAVVGKQREVTIQKIICNNGFSHGAVLFQQVRTFSTAYQFRSFHPS